MEILWEHMSWAFIISVLISLIAVFITCKLTPFNNKSKALENAYLTVSSEVSDHTLLKKEADDWLAKENLSEINSLSQEEIKHQDNDFSINKDINDENLLQYADHIPGKVKEARSRYTAREIEKKMTADQLREEREMQHKQLEQIFNLMQEQSDKFGINSFNDIEDQMKLYTF